MTHQHPTRRFGTWNKAVIAAGLDVANEINISDEKIFENIMLLWEHFLADNHGVLSWLALLLPFPNNHTIVGFVLGRTRLTKFVEFANAQEIQPPTSKRANMGGHKTAP